MSSITNLISVGVNGTGTANSVMKWLDADTATDSIITDNGTNIGIGTSSPATKTDISNELDANAIGSAILTVRNTRLNTGSGAANIRFITNEVGAGIQDNRAQIGAEYDGANGGRLIFSTAQTSTKTITERMRITSSGNVGIGTSSPDETLVINSGASGNNTDWRFYGSGNNVFLANPKSSLSRDVILNNTGSGALSVLVDTSAEPSGTVSGIQLSIVKATKFSVAPITAFSYVVMFYNGNGLVGAITTNGSSTSYGTSSDYRLKENVVPMEGALERVSQLQPSRFNFIADPETTVDGFLAHQVQEVVPEAITGKKDAVEEYEITPAVLDDEGNVIEEAVMGTRPVYQGIDQSKLVPLLVGAIQELKGLVEAQQAEIELLKNK